MTTPLTFGMHLAAFFFGFGSLLVAIGVKFTPFELTEKFPKLDEKVDENSTISKWETKLTKVASSGSVAENLLD